MQQWWEVPGHLEVKGGDLHIEGYLAHKIVDDLYPLHMGERVLFVYSTPWLRQNARDAKRELEGADVFYAGKALELPELVRAAGEEGLGFDAVSPVEVELALKMGIRPENVLMTYEASELGMAYAASKGVPINMNSKGQLRDFYRLVAGHPEFRGAEVMLRRNSAQEGAGWIDDNTTIGADCKFGIREEDIVREALAAKNNGLDVAGFHHHIGSGYGPESADVFLRHARRLAELTAEAIGSGVDTIDRIDYGGGFGVRYRGEQAFLELGDLHRRVMDMHRKTIGDRNLKVMYEPGRRIANCGVMLMRVVRTGEEYIPFIRMNAGFPDFPRPAMYGAYQHIVPVIDTLREPGREVQIAGRICESGDVWTGGKHAKRPMPDVKKGEWLALLNISYGSAMRMRDYCQFPPPLDIIADGSGWHTAEPVERHVNREHPEYFDALRD